MKTSKTTYLSHNESGQTLVEFALIVALFLAIIFGIIEFGRAWFYSNHLTNSVRATARYAAVLNNYTSTGEAAVMGYLDREIDSFMSLDGIDQAKTGIVVRSKDDGSTKNFSDIDHGDIIEVTATYNFQFLSGSLLYGFEFAHVDPDWPMTRRASIPYE